MQIALKKVSPTHHAFTLLFVSGGKETTQLETKTYLYHDLLHFAVEKEAKLTDAFYGRLAKGYRYEELALPEMPVAKNGGDSEGLMVERVVGLMTGVLKHDATPKEAVAGLLNLLSASGEELPVWFDDTFVINVKERMRALTGQWNSTPFGEEMRYDFDIVK